MSDDAERRRREVMSGRAMCDCCEHEWEGRGAGHDGTRCPILGCPGSAIYVATVVPEPPNVVQVAGALRKARVVNRTGYDLHVELELDAEGVLFVRIHESH
jgi:hypothetical protein